MSAASSSSSSCSFRRASGEPYWRSCMSTDIIIQTHNVTRRFGAFTALKDVSIQFERGKLTSIIGPNGAGKSTYFNVLSGAFPPSEGKVVFEGKDLSGLKPHQFSHAGISKSFQITNIFPNFTTLQKG